MRVCLERQCTVLAPPVWLARSSSGQVDAEAGRGSRQMWLSICSAKQGAPFSKSLYECVIANRGTFKRSTYGLQ